jgi:large subunit ribosomal protein L25
MSDITLIAVARNDLGKGASRRLRRTGAVPAIVYGGAKNRKPASISLQHKELLKATQDEAFYASILSLEIDGKAEDVVVMDMQRHPAKPIIMHIDFERVNKSTILHKTIPLHFLNEETAESVKLFGGIVQHNMTEVEVTCKASDLPEYIEVDMQNVELGAVLHLSDLAAPKGVEFTALKHDDDKAVVTIAKKGTSDEVEDQDDAAGDDEATTEA